MRAILVTTLVALTVASVLPGQRRRGRGREGLGGVVVEAECMHGADRGERFECEFVCVRQVVVVGAVSTCRCCIRDTPLLWLRVVGVWGCAVGPAVDRFVCILVYCP